MKIKSIGACGLKVKKLSDHTGGIKETGQNIPGQRANPQKSVFSHFLLKALAIPRAGYISSFYTTKKQAAAWPVSLLLVTTSPSPF